MSLTPDKRGRQTTFLVIAGLDGTIALWLGACAPGPAVTGAQGKPSAPLASQTSLIARRYEQGPYAMGTSTQGDQSGLDMRDRYRLGIQGRDDYARQLYQKGFAQLDTDQQDRVLADLDPTYDDAFGNPLLRITFNFTDNERKMVRYVAEKALTQIIGQMNPAIQQVNDTIGEFNIVPYQSTHLCGGTIVGADPTTSVVNKYCKVWDAPNLFVVGASNFPQNAGYNPTGTVGALAYHTADALVTKYLPNPGRLA